MLRAVIVLPVYLACWALLPNLPAYQQLGDALSELRIDPLNYLIAFGVLAVLGAAIGFYAERHVNRYYVWPKSAAFAVLRIFGIGIVAMSGLQFYYWFADKQFQLFAFFIPLVFVLAEIVYVLIDWIRTSEP